MIGRALIISLTVGLLFVGFGCGEGGADPFVGTWRNVDPSTKPDTRLVIRNVADGYHLAVYDESGRLPYSWSLVRRGDELSGTFVPAEPNPPIKLVVTYRPATGQLLMHETFGPTWELEKVSDSTALPAPSPSD